MMKKQTLLLILISLAFLVILIATIIHIQTGARPLPLAWSASVIVLVSTLLWRFWAVDDTRWATLIEITNPIPEVSLPAPRYLNMMVVAMIVGLAATVSIYQNFIVGVALYLVMQLCLIAAHSGILHLQPYQIRRSETLFRTSLLVSLFWIVVLPLVFFLFVYNGTQSLIMAPYVIALGLMAFVVSLGIAYGARPLLFRCLAALGAALFVFSDAIIGHMIFINPDTSWAVFISPTYVLAIILLSHANLGWSELWGRK